MASEERWLAATWPFVGAWLLFEDQLVGGRRQREAVAAGHRPGAVPPNAALAVQQNQGLLDPIRVASERLGKPSAADRSAVIQQQVECSGQQGMPERRAAAEVWEV